MTARPGRVSSELAIDAPERDAQFPHLGGIRRLLPRGVGGAGQAMRAHAGAAA